MTFKTLGLSDDVLRAVADAGYDVPTPIQKQAIPVVLMARDILGCAQTGTGKTAGFVLPMIDILAQGRAKARMPRSLIIEPTRELAAQVAENFGIYGKYHKLSMALLIGGTSFVDQERALNRGVDVLIATPGRLLDLFERGKILLSDTKLLVIDEADRMLDMGFIPDVEKIVSLLPKIRQTLFFSATMPPEIRRLADAFLMNPKEIAVDPPATAAEMVEDFLAVVPSDDATKRRALRKLLEREEVKNALIFCNRKRDVDTLHRSLSRTGFNTAALHGDLAQATRTQTLQDFRDGKITYLVASDVAARGLDIRDLSHVFNFDVPYNAEDYVHRIGRTGRAGKAGRAFTLAFPEDGNYIAAIIKLIGREIEEIEIEGITREGLVEDDRRGRGRPRRASGRGQKNTDTKSAPRSAPISAQESDTKSAPNPVQETAKQPSRAGESRRDDGARKAKPRSKSPEARRQEERRRERKPEPVADHTGPGMGDHVPAFLVRTARGDS